MSSTARADYRPQLRQPRIAEMVADVLRRRIISGELSDQATLPKQEELIDEFNVSKPSVREALRILETEGLITVLRGNTGGAVVHAPQSDNAAYMLGLVLQAQQVPLRDLGAALKHIEPLCSALCASRPDRATEVVPHLEARHAHSLEVQDDDVLFTQSMREFHEEMVARCGNQTMIQLVGALESLWTSHERDWARRQTSQGSFPQRHVRSTSLKVHARLIRLIDEGKAEAAEKLAREHLGESIFYASSDGEMSINADVLR